MPYPTKPLILLALLTFTAALPTSTISDALLPPLQINETLVGYFDPDAHPAIARHALTNDELEGRGLAGGVGGTLFEEAGGAVVDYIQSGIADDNAGRENFTQSLVQQSSHDHPEFNWMIIHTKHDKNFEGQEGKDWFHTHKEFDKKIGGTVGYELYWFKGGTFRNRGDGGYINWAYVGIVDKQLKDGTIVFKNPRP